MVLKLRQTKEEQTPLQRVEKFSWSETAIYGQKNRSGESAQGARSVMEDGVLLYNFLTHQQEGPVKPENG